MKKKKYLLIVFLTISFVVVSVITGKTIIKNFELVFKDTNSFILLIACFLTVVAVCITLTSFFISLYPKEKIEEIKFLRRLRKVKKLEKLEF